MTADPLTDDELEVLVAPIALYPDELVALVIAASLYPVDIVQGARFLEDLKKDPSLKPSEDWDGSVVSLLNYPDVVKMMSDDLEWTQMLGRGRPQPAEGPARRHPAAPRPGGVHRRPEEH